MSWLNNRTEMSYRAVYGPINDVVAANVCNGDFAGIADLNGTWGHVRWEKSCNAHGVKPIFGVQLAVALPPNKVRRYPYNVMTFVAKNLAGLREIYQLVDIAHQQFYWRPYITYDQLNETSENILLLSGIAPRINLIKRSMFLELSPCTPFAMRNIKGITAIASIDNWYPYDWQKPTYEAMADERSTEKKTTPQHILTYKEWLKIYPGREDALEALGNFASTCNVILPKADMVKFPGAPKLEKLCREGARAKGLVLKREYKDRLRKELDLIRSKGYVDYFLVVADLIKFAKTKMFVGPGRGSSGGSLVCYLLGITGVDPIKYGLLFERFIDPNRLDLPDIDIDFADTKRHLAINYLQNKYGKDNVAQLGNISRLAPKAAINKVAKNLRVPLEALTESKESMIERPAGDSRANFCLFDTFKTTEAGKKLLKTYPEMIHAAEVEGHASHSSVHAAGVLVSNEPITDYCGINSRDKKRIAMIDKRDAEYLNLLKIDVLGLRTLSILADVCNDIGHRPAWLCNVPTDDKKTYEVFNSGRLTGVFQFEGETLRRLAGKMKIESIEDICALTSIARPGPLQAGVSEKYVKASPKKRKKMIIYQEQIMEICRVFAGLPWETVGKIRKALSKSMGAEYMRQYRDAFFTGAKENGHKKEDIEGQWKNIEESGSYLFNKSHALAYSVISYWCAYLKAHYPLAFAVANLNHASSNRSAVHMLRELREHEGIKHIPFDVEKSEKNWTYKDGHLLGGLLTIDGIGPAAANKIIEYRDSNRPLPAGIQKHLNAGVTPFESIYPAEELYGHFYTNSYDWVEDIDIIRIDDIKAYPDGEEVAFIGCLVKKKVKNANSPENVAKRDGKHIDGNTSYLSITLEDDTGQIGATIGRDNYQEIGEDVAKNGKEDKTWYLVIGKFSAEYQHIFINDIMDITNEKAK